MTTATKTTKTAAAKPATKTKAQLEADRRERAARDEHNAKARHKLKFLIRSITQGEWLSICRQLDMSRAAIAGDDNLTLLAAAWVAEKRKHGTSSFDVLLELTDDGLADFHGFQLPPRDDDDETTGVDDAAGE